MFFSAPTAPILYKFVFNWIRSYISSYFIGRIRSDRSVVPGYNMHIRENPEFDSILLVILGDLIISRKLFYTQRMIKVVFTSLTKKCVQL